VPKHDAVDIVEEFARISDAAIAKLVARFARLEPLLLAAITTLEARTDRDTRIEAARALRAALAGIAELETPPAREMPASTLDGDQ
jgi:hypothetical protein